MLFNIWSECSRVEKLLYIFFFNFVLLVGWLHSAVDPSRYVGLDTRNSWDFLFIIIAPIDGIFFWASIERLQSYTCI